MFKPRKTNFLIILLMAVFCLPSLTHAFGKDLHIKPGDLYLPKDIIPGKTIRIYALISSNSDEDLKGVVRFYDEKIGDYLSTDQPVSVLAHKNDAVFIDWTPVGSGDHPIAVRVLPSNEVEDDPSNNKMTTVVNVDIDSDGDGVGNRVDTDDDNDGTPDGQDSFPTDPSEFEDDDGDGLGNNQDTDDDNDGVPDSQDRFPTNSGESKDSDNDGVGDNSDVFPHNPKETSDSDGDGLGDNDDPDDGNHGPILTITVDDKAIPQKQSPSFGTSNSNASGGVQGDSDSNLIAVIDIADSEVTAGKVASFNAINSYDPDGYIQSFEWDFGDGSGIKTGVLVDHIFEEKGLYEVKLKATDDKNEYREDVILIKVKPRWNPYILGGILSIVLIALLALISGEYRLGKNPLIILKKKRIRRKK